MTRRALVFASLVTQLLGVLGIVLTPAAARAGSLGDEPIMDPRLELDPRASFDPRLDRPDPPRNRPPASYVRTPIWVSLGGSFGTLAQGVPVYGAEIQVGIPFDRLAMRGPRAAIAQDARRTPPPAVPGAETTLFAPPPGAPPPVAPPTAAPPPGAPPPGAPPSAPPPSGVPAGPLGRRKLDLTPPPPPPKLVVVGAPVPEVPLRVPAVVTPAVARAAVDAALHHAKLTDPDRKIDALASRARQSAGLPELRLRVLRTADDGQTLSPVSYDPNRIVAVDTIRFWAEARATWRLDRLWFAEEEVSLERMKHERAEAQSKLTKEVLRLLFEWQRGRAHADNPLLSADDNLTARLKVIEAAAELDVLTDGWFGRWRAEHPE